MPVRTYERKLFNGPQNLTVTGYDLDKEDDIDKMSKSLVFLDLSTGLQNRGITRDPICGLGDLPAEIDILQGCSLKSRDRSSGSQGTSPMRDPILLKGDLGEEYNCLYTTKDLYCKPASGRNIITLEGNIGEELDNIRPHGGRPRNNIRNEAIRNPITGSGDFGQNEWDPIWKYEGKHLIKRPEQIQRDPITHSVPMTNMGEYAPKSHFKHFDVNRNTDIISHDDSIKSVGDSRESYQSSSRHYSDQEYRNPITHTEKSRCQEEKPTRSGTRHFYDQIKNEDPIKHHGLSDDIFERNAKQELARQQARCRGDPGIISQDDSIKDLRNTGQITHSGIRYYPDQEYRNPITHIDKSEYKEDEPYQSATKHFNDKRDLGILGHDESIKDLRNTGQIANSGIRFYPDQEYRNPITHIDKSEYKEDKPGQSGTKNFNDKNKPETRGSNHKN